MALVAGRFVVARSPSLESNALVGNETLRAAAAAPAERIGISAGRPCFAAPLRECSHSRMAAVVRGRRPRALVTEFVTEESEVLDAEEVEEVVEEEEENPLIPSAFEVSAFYASSYGNLFSVFAPPSRMVRPVFGIGSSGELISGEPYLYRFKISLCRSAMRHRTFPRCR